MSMPWEDLVVVASLLFSAWAIHAMGFRARSLPIGLALVMLPVVVWLAGKTLLYPALDAAGISRIVGTLPAIATFLAVVFIVLRTVGGVTYRLEPEGGSFGRSLQAAHMRMRRVYRDAPVRSVTGQVPVGPLRKRLDGALVEVTGLKPPSGTWTRLLEERVELHHEYVRILTSPVPLGDDELAPIEQRSREWMRAVEDLIALEERSQR
jgi:hypothetical protein